MRKIADKVMQELGLEKAPSPNTIKKDIATLTKEWLDNRLKDRDEQVQLELERIDDCLCELWEAWYKSKEDYTQTKAKQKHLLPNHPRMAIRRTTSNNSSPTARLCYWRQSSSATIYASMAM